MGLLRAKHAPVHLLFAPRSGMIASDEKYIIKERRIMKSKKLLALLTAGVLGTSMLLSGCGDNKDSAEASQGGSTAEESTSESNPEASGEVQMWDGYYKDESTGLLSFVHFYEDGTYYAKYFEGSILDAGSYQVLEEELEYSVDGGADGDMTTEADNTKATASQVVVMTSYKSREPMKIAYVDDQLCDMSLGGMASHRTMLHDVGYAYNPNTDETAIELFVFYLGNNIGSNFILSHNRTFVDVTGDMFLDGSWDMKEAGVYALTYSDNSKATLTVDASGSKAVLAKADGSELDLKDTYEDEGDLSGVVVMSLTMEDAQVGLPMGVNLRLDCYGDNTCKMIVEVAQIGVELEADQGTYSMSETMKFTFNFENAGEVVGDPDYASATESSIDVAAAYKADVEVEFNGATTPLSVDSEVKGTYVMGGTAVPQEAQIVNTLTAEDAQVGLPMGVNLRLDIYSDDTCKLIVEVAQIGAELEADQGTCSLDTASFKYTFNFENAGELVSEPDYANATAEGLAQALVYQANVEVEFGGAVTPLSIDSVLAGMVTAQ